MKFGALLRRYRWSILLVLLALGGWWLAFKYLIGFRTPDVPYIPTPPEAVDAMLDMANVTANDTVYDLGSGDGRILVAAAKRGARAVGIELDPALVEQSRESVKQLGLSDRISIQRGDIFKENLQPASVITMYLMPHINLRLRPQLDAMPPGTRVVSHMFRIPGAKPVKEITVKSPTTGLDHPVYLWVTPIQWQTP